MHASISAGVRFETSFSFCGMEFYSPYDAILILPFVPRPGQKDEWAAIRKQLRGLARWEARQRVIQLKERGLSGNKIGALALQALVRRLCDVYPSFKKALMEEVDFEYRALTPTGESLHDTYLGICECPRCHENKKAPGTNYWGEALRAIHDELLPSEEVDDSGDCVTEW